MAILKSGKKDMTFSDRLGSLAGSIKRLGGDFPIVFLDTGAIIDFESECTRYWRPKDHRVSPHDFCAHLIDSGLDMFVTSGVLQEVENHHSNHRVSGRPEISASTLNLVRGMNASYNNFKTGVVDPKMDFDEIAYRSYWVSQVIFPEGHKKATRDPMSFTDRELVANSFWTRYNFVPNTPVFQSKSMVLGIRPQTPKGVSGVVVISPDAHIRESVNALNDLRPDITEQFGGKFGYSGVYAIDARHYGR